MIHLWICSIQPSQLWSICGFNSTPTLCNITVTHYSNGAQISYSNRAHNSNSNSKSCVLHRPYMSKRYIIMSNNEVPLFTIISVIYYSILAVSTSLLCFFPAHYAMLQCSWISPKILKIMLTICVNGGQWITNINNNNFYCTCMYIIRCFLLLNHTVYSYNFTVVQYIISHWLFY